MRDFARLYAAIDETNKTNEKVAALADYFRSAASGDAAWAVHFLIGRRPKRLVKGPRLADWAIELAGIPPWLFAECYDAVGDLAETIASVVPEPQPGGTASVSLSQWIEERLLPLGEMSEPDQRLALRAYWSELSGAERFLFNKLLTGSFRVGVSQELVVRALAQVGDLPVAIVSHRLMGAWTPSAEFMRTLLAKDELDADVSRPYPFCLAHPLATDPARLGSIENWHAEWKWDGIRAQVIRRGGQSFVWTRGEDLVTQRFPEVARVCDDLPEGTVLDGEILAWSEGRPMKFLDLQKRIGLKTLTPRILERIPVVLVAFDVLEWRGEDVRGRRLPARRHLLEQLTRDLSSPALMLSGELPASNWEDLTGLRSEARARGVEGLMLKRKDSAYETGRKKGIWWKWKIDPMTVDCVLMYAQRGHGKRASLYTDYTFGVWNEGQLVPLAKAYSGLTDEEIRRVDTWVRRNTLERFGPVRTVKPELVFELGFEAIQLSSRHKSGLAVRFPRMLRWRHDKKADEADTLEGVKAALLMPE